MKKKTFLFLLFFIKIVAVANNHATQNNNNTKSYTSGHLSTDVIQNKIIPLCDYNTCLLISTINKECRAYFLDRGEININITPTVIVCDYKAIGRFCKTFKGKVHIVLTTNIFNGKDNNKVIKRIKKLFKHIENFHSIQFDAVELTPKQWQKLLIQRKWIFKKTPSQVMKQIKSLSLRSSIIPNNILSKLFNGKTNLMEFTFDLDSQNKEKHIEALKLLPPIQKLTIEGNGLALSEFFETIKKNKNKRHIKHIVIKDYHSKEDDQSFKLIPDHIEILELYRIFPLYINLLAYIPTTIKKLFINMSAGNAYLNGSQIEDKNVIKKYIPKHIEKIIIIVN